VLRIALQSLVHEKGKLVAALFGVAFAASLVLAQTGLYVGMRRTTASVVARVGGDLWVMAKGTQLLDFADNLSAGTRNAVAAHPCVTDARGVVFSWTVVRKPSGGIENVQLIGYEPRGQNALPWSMAAGLPGDLHGPMRVSVDSTDLERLEVAGPPARAVGTEMQLGGQSVYVGAVSRGIRSFTVVPYLFAEARNAQRMVGLAENQYTYWAIDLREPGCKADVIRTIERSPDLEAHGAEEFGDMTSDYWILRSGAGATLGFSALLGLIIGVVIVGQTLFAMTENRLRELATLKAMGASNVELIRFVAWQAAFLGVLGGALGVVLALGMKRGVAAIGLSLVLSPGVLGIGLGSILFMCALASLASVRKVLSLEAAAVFK
jgi:putative ABC transport system permease protein